MPEHPIISAKEHLRAPEILLFVLRLLSKAEMNIVNLFTLADVLRLGLGF